MKQYCAHDGQNTYIHFTSDEKLQAYLADHPAYRRVIKHEWQSEERLVYSRNYPRYGMQPMELRIEGEVEFPLEEAIKNRLVDILSAVDLSKVGCYRLKSFHIHRDGDRCILTMSGWNTSEGMVDFDPKRDWAENKLKTKQVTFTGVEDGDLHADDFDVEIK